MSRHLNLRPLSVLVAVVVLVAGCAPTSAPPAPVAQAAPSPDRHLAASPSPVPTVIPLGSTATTPIAGLALPPPTLGTRIATIPVGHGPSFLAVSDGAVWVANTIDATIARIDPHTKQLLAMSTLGTDIPSEGCCVGSVVVSQGALWVVSDTANTVTRIDPSR